MAQGFVLLELVVTVAIIGILSGMILVGLPKYRQQQAIILTEQQLSADFREASERALNEQRDQACLDRVDPDSGNVKTCSDIGLSLQGTTITMFADLSGNSVYDTAKDYLIREDHLPPSAMFIRADTGTGRISADFVFHATPPVITLSSNSHYLITTQTGDAQTQFFVNNYGLVAKQ